ncbi:arylamine N-acetyltransferase [Mycolicibacterium pulveris]|uniref:Arylamine N-acetyltransferase n=1 Tax=Mycolicibacterium pulveris TaxID=36813 RepID=A0A7I7UIF4_MYCPV|nr:arylamine N-acetyltransferase [Mycolicibacterium pulveris]MCV6979654.1 arylamine N-acetyltransferase [Mycolicibacterium pulveris]BBY80900.1 arylamine N-acetyltransferase [Mycolicibacterium pulveris]
MTTDVSPGLDLAAYLDRIGYTGPTAATVDTLSALVSAHLRSIPFENLDPLMGIPVADLSAAALSAKLVQRRRGGYCFEQNGVMGYVLTELGYGVERLGGRVVWMRDSDELPAQTHETLSVTVPGDDGRWLVDVGLGGQTLSSPILLEAGLVQQTRHEPYRLREHADGYMLESQIRDEWRPLYMFGIRPQPLIDREVASWYVSTHPDSGFVQGLTAALVTDDARCNLRGRHLAIHSADGTERVRFEDAAAVMTALTERFGIDLTNLGDSTDIEARITEVLDT